MFPTHIKQKPKWTTEEMDKLIKRTVNLIKGTMTLSAKNVAVQAAYRSNDIPKHAIEQYLNDIDGQKRIELGFPDPNAKNEGLTTRPNSPSSLRSTWKAN